jgi:hypothetical protein
LDFFSLISSFYENPRHIFTLDLLKIPLTCELCTYPYINETQGVIWNAEDVTNPGQMPEFDNMLHEITDVAFIPHENLLAVNGVFEQWLLFFIYDLEQQEQVGAVSYGYISAPGMSVSPLGTYLVEHNDGRLWRIEDVIGQHEEFQDLPYIPDEFPPHFIQFPQEAYWAYIPPVFSQNESLIFIGYNFQGGHILIWNLSSDEELVNFTAHDVSIYAAALNPTEEILATIGCAISGDIYPKCDALEIKLWDTKTFEMIATLASEHEIGAHDLTFSPDGRYLISSNSHFSDGYEIFESDSTIRLLGVPSN